MTILRGLKYATCGILSLLVGGLAVADSTPAPTRATGGGAIEEKSNDQAKALFEKKCSQCHSLERILKTQKGDDWWSGTVRRMSEMPGADISGDDIAHIMHYILEEMPPPGQ